MMRFGCTIEKKEVVFEKLKSWFPESHIFLTAFGIGDTTNNQEFTDKPHFIMLDTTEPEDIAWLII